MAHSRPLVRQVVAAIRRHRLLTPGMSVLVAVSGGPDSVGLLHLLHRLAPAWKLSLSVVHCNYGLRGQESEDDEQFVRRLSARLNVPCTVRRLSLGSYEAAPRGSLQERARVLRYRVFRELAARERIDRVALGHTADDQAETVLLWMVRGAGSAGLSGMPVERERLYVRPLLGVTRAAMLDYLSSQRLDYRTDSSNRRTAYLRNRIRHQLLPVLAELNPAIVQTLGRQAAVLRAEDSYLHELTLAALAQTAQQSQSGEVVLERAALLRFPLAIRRRVLREVLRQFHPERKAPLLTTVSVVEERLLRGNRGTRVVLPMAVITREHDRLVVRPGKLTGTSSTAEDPIRLVVNPMESSTVRWPGTDAEIRLTIVSAERFGPTSNPKAGSARVVFDADRVTGPLVLRTWRPGDWFCPAGMAGHRKKLQDFWIDAKIARAARQAIPILEAAEGILWVVGLRADERFVAGTGTSRLLVAEVATRGMTGDNGEASCQGFSVGRS